ncbi:FAD-dependent monooxygenase [Mycobacterium sp.]|uniref:FAD-dependent monooxygenase n=1 Tax=Mycobacterium sp. TaxID=1785 RepID=UPI002CDF9481|nr:FAD-dependent monooxygenase [Mycobacterium sp.]HTQ22754.1 FAD-dependent monooxygenase [Mycobacterium sp.]
MRVVICGAGIAGLTLANRCSVLGAEVVMLERSRGPRPQGYMIDFFGPGHDTADAMGLLPAIKDVAYRIEEANLVDDRGRRRATARPSQFTDGPLLDVMRPDLEQVLRENLPPAVDLRFGVSPVAISDHREAVRVTVDDGTQLEADLVVGADGLHSAVRRMTFGEESNFLRYLGFHTAAFSFVDPELHAALQGRFCLTDTVDRQMGLYALRDGRVAVFAVHRAPDPAPPDDARAAVREVYNGLKWVVPQVLRACPSADEMYYDQVAQTVMPNWSRGRVTLLGDACYAVSLIAGQGASLGMAGAYVLADQLASAPTVDEALAGYERLWRPVAEEKQEVGRSAAHWFLPASTWQLLMRHVMLRAARLPFFDRVIPATLVGKSSALIVDLHRAGTRRLPETQREGIR